jgi:hypothetical protein
MKAEQAMKTEKMAERWWLGMMMRGACARRCRGEDFRMLVCAESAWEGLPLRRAFSMVGCGWGGLPGLVFGAFLAGNKNLGFGQNR